MPTAPPSVTLLPTPPSRDDSVNFSTRADAFLGALPNFQTDTNAVATNVFNNAVEVNTNATTVASNTTLAVNSANAAAASAGAALWVSGTTYALGAVVWSPANGQIYRRIIAGGGTTDPSADGTNWTSVYAFTFNGNNATLNGGMVINELGADADTRIEGDTDANLFFVDASTDRVGIKTNTPASDLDVNGSVTLSTGTANGVLYLNGSKVATTGSALVFDGTNLGLGLTSPTRLLHIDGGASGTYFQMTNTASGRTNADGFQIIQDGANVELVNRENGSIIVYTNNTERMRLDSAGNLGLGVTPSAWNSLFKAIDFSTTASLAGASGGANLFNNAYWNGSNYIYKTTAGAARYLQSGNEHYWYTAPSGTAGNTISFSTAMVLDASNNLLLGTTSTTVWNGSAGTKFIVGGANNTIASLQTSTTSADQGAILEGLSSAVTSGSKALGSIAFLRENTSTTALSSYTAFYTNNAGTVAQRARITAGGYFKASNDGTYVGSTANYHELRGGAANGYTCVVASPVASPASQYVFDIRFSAATPNDTNARFWSCTDATAERAYMRSNGGLSNYQSNNTDLSDARTKNSITPAASMWDKIGALEIVTYKYNDQTHDDVNVGVIAQQVEAVEPVWVDSDGWNKETPEGEEPLKTVYTKDITFAAIKALQEAMTRIEALEAEVAALKEAK